MHTKIIHPGHAPESIPLMPRRDTESWCYSIIMASPYCPIGLKRRMHPHPKWRQQSRGVWFGLLDSLVLGLLAGQDWCQRYEYWCAENFFVWGKTVCITGLPVGSMLKMKPWPQNDAVYMYYDSGAHKCSPQFLAEEPLSSVAKVIAQNDDRDSLNIISVGVGLKWQCISQK